MTRNCTYCFNTFSNRSTSGMQNANMKCWEKQTPL